MLNSGREGGHEKQTVDVARRQWRHGTEFADHKPEAQKGVWAAAERRQLNEQIQNTLAQGQQ